MRPDREGAILQMLANLVEDRLGTKVADAKGNPWGAIHSPLMEYDELMLERAGQTCAGPRQRLRAPGVDRRDRRLAAVRARLSAD